MTAVWETDKGVACVVCPACAFTFAAYHTDDDGIEGYSCPCCGYGTKLAPTETELLNVASTYLRHVLERFAEAVDNPTTHPDGEPLPNGVLECDAIAAIRRLKYYASRPAKWMLP